MAGYVTQKRATDRGLSWKTWDEIRPYNEGRGAVNNSPWRSDVAREVKYLDTQETYSFRTAGEVGAKELREGYLNARSGREDRPSSTFDNGHEFNSLKKSGWFSHPDTFLIGKKSTSSPSSSNDFYRGVLTPRGPTSFDIVHPEIPPLTPSEIGYYGAQAINRTIPTHASVSLAQIVGELKEGLPSLIGASFIRDRASFFRSLGGEYLNVEFGWKPFISDFLSIIDSVNTASKQITQYQRDSGRNVRRKYSFPDILAHQVVVDGQPPSGGFPFEYAVQGGYFSKVGLYSFNRFSQQRIWFKGAYTYHIPVGKTVLDKLSMYESLVNKLLGTRLTPETLWELTPWSWLVDWVANIGDVVSNHSALQSDNLVMRYGYLMRQSVVVDTHTHTGAVTSQGRDLGTVTMVLRTERKERVRATPYGFGLNPNLFTDRQWAILGALGMTKSPRMLR